MAQSLGLEGQRSLDLDRYAFFGAKTDAGRSKVSGFGQVCIFWGEN